MAGVLDLLGRPRRRATRHIYRQLLEAAFAVEQTPSASARHEIAASLQWTDKMVQNRRHKQKQSANKHRPWRELSENVQPLPLTSQSQNISASSPLFPAHLHAHYTSPGILSYARPSWPYVGDYRYTIPAWSLGSRNVPPLTVPPLSSTDTSSPYSARIAFSMSSVNTNDISAELTPLDALALVCKLQDVISR